jgi:hypothetical protein
MRKHAAAGTGGLAALRVSREKWGEVSTLIPGRVFESLADQLADLLFEDAVMGDAPAAFAGLSGAERWRSLNFTRFRSAKLIHRSEASFFPSSPIS